LHFQSAELAKLALALVVSCFACTALGLCIGALGLRGRSVSVFAACIGALMLIVSGANVPFDRLPHVVRTVASGSL
jgi:ABC-type polysaccharide/polyol phosphate export permease